MPELRVNLGYGYLKLRIKTKMDAIKILILTRHCGAALYYNINDPYGIILLGNAGYNEVVKILEREGYLDTSRVLGE